MICPICAHEKHRVFFAYASFCIEECKCCRFRFVDITSSSYPSDAQYVYDEPELGNLNPGQPHIQRRVRDILRFSNHSRGRSLDIGCGKGEVAIAMRDVGFLSSGIDMKPHVIQQLQHAYPAIDWKCAMTTDLVNLKDRFDVLTMYHVLEHIPDPIAALSTVKDLAEPGALIVVEVPNVGGLKAKFLGKRWGYYKVDHVNYFRKCDLISLGEKLGLEILSIRGYQHFSYPQNVLWKDTIKGIAAALGFQDVVSAFYRVPS